MVIFAGKTGAIEKDAAGPELIERLKKRWPQFSTQIDQLVTGDPTGNLRWLDWSLKQVRGGAQPDKINEVLKECLAQRVEPTQFSTLDDAIAAVMPTPEVRPAIVYAKDGWTIYQIQSREQLCEMSPGKWCVGWTHTDEHWVDYNKHSNPRFFVIQGPTPKSPYLLFVSDSLEELKDRGNANVAAADPVHAVLDDAGLERNQASQYLEEFWTRIRDEIERQLYNYYFGWESEMTRPTAEEAVQHFVMYDAEQLMRVDHLNPADEAQHIVDENRQQIAGDHDEEEYVRELDRQSDWQIASEIIDWWYQDAEPIRRYRHSGKSDEWKTAVILRREEIGHLSEDDLKLLATIFDCGANVALTGWPPQAVSSILELLDAQPQAETKEVVEAAATLVREYGYDAERYAEEEAESPNLPSPNLPWILSRLEKARRKQRTSSAKPKGRCPHCLAPLDDKNVFGRDGRFFHRPCVSSGPIGEPLPAVTASRVKLAQIADRTKEDIQKLKQAAPAIIARVQQRYNEWQVTEDSEDGDWEVGFGGLCHLFADIISDEVSKLGFDAIPTCSNYEQHVYVVVRGTHGIYKVDIPYGVYETGGGFSWKKIPDVAFESSDVTIRVLSWNRKDMREFVDEWEGDEDEWEEGDEDDGTDRQADATNLRVPQDDFDMKDTLSSAKRQLPHMPPLDRQDTAIGTYPIGEDWERQQDIMFNRGRTFMPGRPYAIRPNDDDAGAPFAKDTREADVGMADLTDMDDELLDSTPIHDEPEDVLIGRQAPVTPKTNSPSRVRYGLPSAT